MLTHIIIKSLHSHAKTARPAGELVSELKYVKKLDSEMNPE